MWLCRLSSDLSFLTTFKKNCLVVLFQIFLTKFELLIPILCVLLCCKFCIEHLSASHFAACLKTQRMLPQISK